MSATPRPPEPASAPAPDDARALRALERRCRGLGAVAWAGFLTAAFALGVLVLQRLKVEAGTVRAQGFVLEDLAGRVRASLDLPGDERDVRLVLRDREGRMRLMATVDAADITQVHLRDANGLVRIGMGVLPGGDPLLSLNGADGLPRATVRVEGEGAHLWLREGPEGEPLVISPRGGGR